MSHRVIAGEPAQFAPLDAPGVFPTAIGAPGDECEDGESARALLELRIWEVSGAIRDRGKWWEKASDETIVTRWPADFSSGDCEEDAAVFNYALAEARYQAAQFPGPHARPPRTARSSSTTCLRHCFRGSETVRRRFAQLRSATCTSDRTGLWSISCTSACTPTSRVSPQSLATPACSRRRRGTLLLAMAPRGRNHRLARSTG